MPRDPASVSGSFWSDEFIEQLKDDEFRSEFVTDQVRTKLALQIRALREQEGREWNQTQLGEYAGMAQSAVCRIEDPDYGKLTLQTLFKVAAAFKLPLIVEFGEWDDWLLRMNNVSKSALERKSFDPDSLMGVNRHQVSYEGSAARAHTEFMNQLFRDASPPSSGPHAPSPPKDFGTQISDQKLLDARPV